MKKMDELKNISARARRNVLEMIARAGKGHIGGSLSCVDILVALYCGGLLNNRPEMQNDDSRDRFLMSKGHSAEGLYAVLAEASFLSQETLETYGQDGSPLGGHPDWNLPGVEISSGSLGQGLGIGAGLALATRKMDKRFLTFVLLGDGECYEGSVWEAANFASHHQLSNLIAIVDRNEEITLDKTENLNRLEPFAQKWQAFGWETREIDGHSFEEILSALEDVRLCAEKPAKPLAVIAKTVKGKGVSFMEREVGWHHRVPKGDLLEQARKELA